MPNLNKIPKTEDHVFAPFVSLLISKREKFEEKCIEMGTATKLWRDTEFAKIVKDEEAAKYDEIDEYAFEYPFELDVFQKLAIVCIERNENIFVAAHTSAGKTVVAEYAIAVSIKRNKTRVIYTSPIKALSNQKLRDFRITFGKEDVGLLTGDVQVNDNAPCLIMTTEILLLMLYRGSPVINDLEWVIFDEVHYVNDKDRGHVWEEIFIMLPSHIHLVFLSATIPNVMEFADWLGMIRNSSTRVVYTTKRPVPLEHFLYTGSNGKTMNECFMFIDSNSNFLRNGYEAANEAKKSRQTKFDKNFGPLQKRNVNPKTDLNVYISLIRFLEKEEKLPIIAFTLSRIKCYSNASTLSEAIDLTTGAEKGRIHRFIKRSLVKLKDVDRKIPQILEMTEMLKKGFGMHHSGILPIMKEITEILFGEGLVKVLFATETFAMGVNMPAKCVSFDSLDKYDGIQQRPLNSSEYIQMAGRAGRRGKDKTGTVIILCKADLPEMGELENMTLGKPTALISQFRLTYSMILNLLKSRQELRIEDILKKSFVEHRMQKSVESMIKQQDILRKTLNEKKTVDCDVCSKDIDEFGDKYCVYKQLLEEIIPRVWTQGAFMKKISLFKDGRMLLFDSPSNPFSFGIVLGSKVVRGVNANTASEVTVISVDPMKFIAYDGQMESFPFHIETITLSSIHIVFKHFLKVNGSNVLKEKTMAPHKRDETVQCLTDLSQFFLKMHHQLPITSISNLFFISDIDAIKDIGIRDVYFYEKYSNLVEKRNYLLRFTCLSCDSFVSHFNKTLETLTLKQEVKDIAYYLSPSSLRFLPDYESRCRVLKKRNYINDELCLEAKGKVASLMSEHELVITEMIFDNLLGELTPEEIAAVMAAFVFQEKDSGNEMELNDTLKKKIEEVKKIAYSIAFDQKACDLDIVIEDFVQELKFGLTEVVYHWAKGMSFADVMEYTWVQEGIIVRCIQRLDELLRHVQEAAKLFGDDRLVKKFDEAAQCVRRDIVFAASLYIENDAFGFDTSNQGNDSDGDEE